LIEALIKLLFIYWTASTRRWPTAVNNILIFFTNKNVHHYHRFTFLFKLSWPRCFMTSFSHSQYTIIGIIHKSSISYRPYLVSSNPSCLFHKFKPCFDPLYKNSHFYFSKMPLNVFSLLVSLCIFYIYSTSKQTVWNSMYSCIQTLTIIIYHV